MAGVSLRGVRKSYGDELEVIHGVDLEIEDGRFAVFVGPSGCGKSTLLRMIAGLEEISGGEIAIGGRVVNEVAPSKRGVAMVFQSYALYPHMSVRRNMAFGLKQARLPAEEIASRVAAAAEALEITPLLDRSPRRLSAASASASPSGGPSSATPRSSSLTSPSPIWTPPCAPRRAWNSPASTSAWARP